MTEEYYENIIKEIDSMAIMENGYFNYYQGNKNSAIQIELKSSAILCHSMKE